MAGYATPDSLDPGDKRRIIELPADPALWRAISGALFQLAEPENWEEVGTQTPEDTAEFFLTWFRAYTDSTEDIP